MSSVRSLYRWYDDMTVVHIENGYLVFLLILLMCYNVGVFFALMLVPSAQPYFVPGLKTAQEVRVIWGHEYGSAENVSKLAAPQIEASVITEEKTKEPQPAVIQIEVGPLVNPGQPIPEIDIP